MTQSNESKPVPSSEAQADSTPASAPTKEAADALIAEGKKAMALKQWEEGVAKYADALDIMRGIVGEKDPSMAPSLLSYGKALFELAVSQSGVMGKEEPPKIEEDDDDEGGPSTLIESADPEILAEAEAEAAALEQGEDVPPEETPSGEAGIDEEPEDDYNAAWEVLDVARTIYLKFIEESEGGSGKGKGKVEEDDEGIKKAKLCLADCYQTLGDISCETENFEQAVSDYTSALNLLTPLYPTSSRILASLHFTLGTALEFLPSRRSDALSHVQSALSSFLERQKDLEKPSDQMSNQDLAKLNPKEREAEKKEVGELIGDLEVKVEELKSAPEGEGLVEEGIRHLVGGGENAFGGGSGEVKKDEGPVNDMSGMVKRKKKPVVAAVNNATAGASNAGATVVEKAKGAVEGIKGNLEGMEQTAEIKDMGKTAQKAVEAVKEQAASAKEIATGKTVQNAVQTTKETAEAAVKSAKEGVETVKEVAQGETVQNAIVQTKETAKGIVETAKEGIEAVREVAQSETVQNALKTVQGTVDGVVEAVKGKAESIKETIQEKSVDEIVEDTREITTNAVESVKGTVGTIKEKVVAVAVEAMDVVDASMEFTEKVNGGEKRAAEGEDGERASKRAKAE